MNDGTDMRSWLDLGILRPLLDVIDQQIDKLRAMCDRDPSHADALWFDDWEALVGLGFVACQQFLVNTYRRFGDSKRGSLARGPQHASGTPYAQAVDAAANFWKHEGEWVTTRPEDPELRTRTILERLCSTRQDYVLANVLRVLVEPEDARFVHLVPWLERWRDSLDSAT